jgi:oligopeptide transport system substrate-binding protein
MTPERIALRRALSMSYDTEREMAVLQRNQAIAAQQIVPQSLPGFAPNYHPLMNAPSPHLANQLLDHYGYKINATGWRQQPNGKALILELSSTPDSKSRMHDEFWTRNARQLHIQLKIKKARFPDLLKAEKECKLQMRGAAWIADYADGDNFMMLLYGKNIHQSNNACFQDPQYDAWYEQSQKLPDSPERTALYLKMNRHIEHLAPWKLGVSRYQNSLVHRYVKGFQQHPLIRADWMYLAPNDGINVNPS